MPPFVLAAGEVWTNPLIVGLIVGVPGTVLGALAYRRSEKLDRDAAQSAAIAGHSSTIQQVIDGLNHIVDNLQDDNKVLRADGTDLIRRLRECNDLNADLQRRVAGG